MKRLLLIFLGVTSLVLVIIVLVLSLRRPPIVPETITHQANFAIFYPQSTKQMSIKPATFKYDQSLKQVSFIVRFDGRNITFAEQSSPDSFADDPNFYAQLIKSLKGYTSFDSVNGTVDLTRPTEVKSEAGVMNAKGTLLFAKSDGDLGEDNWKLLFNSLVYTSPH